MFLRHTHHWNFRLMRRLIVNWKYMWAIRTLTSGPISRRTRWCSRALKSLTIHGATLKKTRKFSHGCRITWFCTLHLNLLKMFLSDFNAKTTSIWMADLIPASLLRKEVKRWSKLLKSKISLKETELRKFTLKWARCSNQGANVSSSFLRMTN